MSLGSDKDPFVITGYLPSRNAYCCFFICRLFWLGKTDTDAESRCSYTCYGICKLVVQFLSFGVDVFLCLDQKLVSIFPPHKSGGGHYFIFAETFVPHFSPC